MKLNTALTGLFTKLGIAEDAEAKTILGNPSLASIEVPDGLSTKLQTDYLTKESALQNPDIRSTIVAETLNGVDAQVKEMITKYELPAEKAATILSEKKTSKKLSLLYDEVVELTKEKNKAVGADKEAFNKQIADLNKQILEKENTYKSELENERNARKSDKMNWELDTTYAGFDYVNKDVEKKLNIVSAKAVINAIAEQKGLKFTYTDDGAIKIKTKTDTDYFENNVPVSYSDFIQKNLIANKMIAVSGGGQGQQGQQRQQGNLSNIQTSHSSFNDALNSRIENSKY